MSSLAAPIFSSADRAIFIVYWAVYEELRELLCHPYGVRDQESEPSRHKRFGAVLGTLEEHAGLTSCILRREASLPGLHVTSRHDTAHEVGVV